MYMLALAAESDPIGFVLINGRNPTPDELAAMFGGGTIPEIECWLKELGHNGVYRLDAHGRMYNKRMVDDAKLVPIKSRAGKMGHEIAYGKRRTNSRLPGTTRNPLEESSTATATVLEERRKEESESVVVRKAPDPPPPTGHAHDDQRRNGGDHARPRTRLPENWEPDADQRAYATDRGLNADEIAFAFRTYWSEKRGVAALKADWRAAWIIWCNRDASHLAAVASTARARGPGPDGRGVVSLMDAASRVAADFARKRNLG
jgi:hypothetical protein